MDEPDESAAVAAPDSDAAAPPVGDGRSRLGVILVILLGLAAVLTAWSTLVAAGYASAQASAYAKANLLAVQGSQATSAADQMLQQDKAAATQLIDLMYKVHDATKTGDQRTVDLSWWQVDNLVYGRSQSQLRGAMTWVIDEYDRTGELRSPFEMPGIFDKYFADANALIAQSADARAEGDQARHRADRFGLVQVGYAVVLLLLGIAEPVRRFRPRLVIIAVAGAGLLATSTYLLVVQLAALGPQGG